MVYDMEERVERVIAAIEEAFQWDPEEVAEGGGDGPE